MQGYQDWAEHFSDIEKMPQRPPAEIFAAMAVTAGLDWRCVVYVGVVP